MTKPSTYKGHPIQHGMTHSTVRKRIASGMSIEEACSKPPLSRSQVGTKNGAKSYWRRQGVDWLRAGRRDGL